MKKINLLLITLALNNSFINFECNALTDDENNFDEVYDTWHPTLRARAEQTRTITIGTNLDPLINDINEAKSWVINCTPENPTPRILSRYRDLERAWTEVERNIDSYRALQTQMHLGGVNHQRRVTQRQELEAIRTNNARIRQSDIVWTEAKKSAIKIAAGGGEVLAKTFAKKLVKEKGSDFIAFIFGDE